MSTFEATTNKGFRMTFDNGFTISVQWGTVNYCERKNFDDGSDPQKERIWESVNAEVAVFDKEDGMLGIGDNDQVIGWLSTDQVTKVISIVQSSKTREEIELKIKTLRL